MDNEFRNKKGQLIEGHPGLKQVGSENKLTRKAKYLLNRYYDELKRAGVKTLVNDSSSSDKLKAILAGIPKDLNIKHSGNVNHNIDLSKLTDEQLEQLRDIKRSLDK